MAISHFSVKTGSRQKGQSASAQFAYLCRLGRYQGKGDLEHVGHYNYPDWSQAHPQLFWQAADEYERANARLYTQIECALPRELDATQRLDLLEDFLERELGARFPYTCAVHNPAALDGQENPHAHILFSERRVDGIERPREQFFSRANQQHPEKGGAAKDRDWSRQAKIGELRDSWQQSVNHALAQAGRPERVDLRSLQEQGSDRVPEPKMGPLTTEKYRQGDDSEIVKVVQSCRSVRQGEERLKAIEREIDTYKARLALATRDHPQATWVPASQLYELAGQRKQALYQQLSQLKAKRYELGVRWSPSGYIPPPPLSREAAYQQALRTLGGAAYVEAERKVASAAQHVEDTRTRLEHHCQQRKSRVLQRLLPHQNELKKQCQAALATYKQVELEFQALKSHLEHPNNRAILKAITRQSLKQERRRQQQLAQLAKTEAVLQDEIKALQQYQQELRCLGAEKLAVRAESPTPHAQAALADLDQYQAQLRAARARLAEPQRERGPHRSPARE
jgi:hypothetical protein